MVWYGYVAHFFGALFLTNSVPHLVQGISGNPFPSPFASPPGRGNSSPMINVAWGAANLIVGGFLVLLFTDNDPRPLLDLVLMGLGALAFALMLARAFGERHG